MLINALSDRSAIGRPHKGPFRAGLSLTFSHALSYEALAGPGDGFS